MRGIEVIVSFPCVASSRIQCHPAIALLVCWSAMSALGIEVAHAQPGDETVEQTFDSHGRLVKEKCAFDLDGDGFAEHKEYRSFEYDFRGRTSRKILRWQRPGYVETTDFIYVDSSNELVSEVKTVDENGDGTPERRWLTKFENEAGRVKRKMVEFYEGMEKSPAQKVEHIFVYSPAGKLAEETRLTREGPIESVSAKELTSFNYDGDRLTNKRLQIYDPIENKVASEETVYFDYHATGELRSVRTTIDSDADGVLDKDTTVRHQPIARSQYSSSRLWAVFANIFLALIALLVVLRRSKGTRSSSPKE